MRSRMNFVRLRGILVVVVLMFISAMGYGQQVLMPKSTVHPWEVGFNVGMTCYMGDISTVRDPFGQLKHNSGFGGEITLSKQVSSLFGFRGNLLIGKLHGLTGSGTQSFTSDLIETSLSASLNLSELIKGPDRKHKGYNVYGLLGLGLANFNGSSINTTNGTVIRSFGHHQGAGIGGYELDGIGNAGLYVDIDLGKNLKAIIASNFKFLSNDELDGINSGFKLDFYHYNSVGIAYTFAKPKHQVVKVNTSEAILPVVTKVVLPEVKEKSKEEVVAVKQPEPVAKPVIKPVVQNEQPNPPVEKKDSLVIKLEKQMALEAQKRALMAERLKAEAKAKEDAKNNPDGLSANELSYSGYKVQILATQRVIDAKSILKKYTYATEIRIDKANKLNHCSIGSFTTFKAAKKFCDNLRIKRNLKYAFVVKFENGKRIGSVKK
jgi:hypothetical protein